ncbi:MAG: hypothetical protein KatS3mg129_1273 [Leptospiraceae bacterium]|nr:MAG: hypothetical protein KatS3mg129_1273 [Leptospiraceae bacterium]
MTRFFYWYVIYKYFINYPIYIFTGLGEYEWGYLYKYLTFDIKEFPYIDFTDYRFFFHSHAHNDIVSFLIGGGLIYLGIYLYIIFKVLMNSILEKKNYILFAVFLISLLHGITEPFSFSPYTGYIFWFSGIILLFFYDIKPQRLLMKKINMFIIKKIKKSIICILMLLILYFFILLNLKNPFYLEYYLKDLPRIKKLYENTNNIEVPNFDINNINNKLKKINLLIVIKPLEIENYYILSDYYYYLYFKEKDKKWIRNSINLLCKSVDLKITIFNYINIKRLKNQYNLLPPCIDKLNRFDPFNLLGGW